MPHEMFKRYERQNLVTHWLGTVGKRFEDTRNREKLFEKL